MIVEEIKLYDEPLPYVHTGHSVDKPTAEFEKMFNDHLETAKNRCNVGDTVISANNPNSRMVILGFVPSAEVSQRYNGYPCVVKAANPAYASNGGIQYSLGEILWDTLIKAPQGDSAND